MTYFLIDNLNGDTHVRALSADFLLASLMEEDGTIDMDNIMLVLGESDPAYWSGRQLIIKGEIVAPRPVSVKYELP